MEFNLSFVIRFILAALATYRLAWFTKEDGPFGIFAHVRAWLGKWASKAPGKLGLSWTLAEIVNCPHCVGVWLALLFAPAMLWPNRITDIIIITLAIAGLQSYLTGRGEE
jgi:hypothetical protein